MQSRFLQKAQKQRQHAPPLLAALGIQTNYGNIMSFGEKVKESIVNRAAEGLAVSVSIILIWVVAKIGPVILPALESSLSKSLLVSLLLASLALTLVFVVVFWVTRKKSKFRLKYGIYWDSDKNLIAPIVKFPLQVTLNIQQVLGTTVNLVKKYSRFRI
jgi:tetrahydromethanopterin S-methyltransferase subunit E